MLFGGLTFDSFPCYEVWSHFILCECVPVLLDVVCQCFYDCSLGCGTEGVFLHDGMVFRLSYIRVGYNPMQIQQTAS